MTTERSEGTDRCAHWKTGLSSGPPPRGRGRKGPGLATAVRGTEPRIMCGHSKPKTIGGCRTATPAMLLRRLAPLATPITAKIAANMICVPRHPSLEMSHEFMVGDRYSVAAVVAAVGATGREIGRTMLGLGANKNRSFAGLCGTRRHETETVGANS